MVKVTFSVFTTDGRGNGDFLQKFDTYEEALDFARPIDGYTIYRDTEDDSWNGADPFVDSTKLCESPPSWFFNRREEEGAIVSSILLAKGWQDGDDWEFYPESAVRRALDKLRFRETVLYSR